MFETWYYEVVNIDGDYANLRRRLFEIVNDARSEETIKKELEIKFNEQLVSYYETSQENLYNLKQIQKLKYFFTFGGYYYGKSL